MTVSDRGAANLRSFARLHEALQSQELDVVAAHLHPEVEVIGMKGVFRGVDEVRRWATKSAEGTLYSTVEVDETEAIGDEWVAIQARRLWRWREDDEVADEAGFGGLFRFRDGRVIWWRQDYESIIAALDAIPEGR